MGQLERADRAYNALLLLVSRARSAGAPLAEAGLAETLFELHRLADLRGASGRAAENLESAFDERARATTRRGGWRPRCARPARARCWSVRWRRASVARPIRASAPAIFAEMGRTLDEGGQPSAGLTRSCPRSARRRARRACTRPRASSRSARGSSPSTRRACAELSERALESGDSRLASMLLVRLALSREAEGALDEAAVLLSRAEDTGEHLPIVWRAIARVASARGDGAAALVALRKTDSGELSDEERARTRHALARLELSSDATRDAGLETLERAVAAALGGGGASGAARGGGRRSGLDARGVRAGEPRAEGARRRAICSTR